MTPGLFILRHLFNPIQSNPIQSNPTTAAIGLLGTCSLAFTIADTTSSLILGYESALSKASMEAGRVLDVESHALGLDFLLGLSTILLVDEHSH